MTRWVVGALGPDVPMHFTAFHPDYRMRDRENTPLATVVRAQSIARRNGVRYAYTGNVHNPSGESTRCHACDALLIGRDRYRLTTWGLTGDGRCRACGEAWAGSSRSARAPGARGGFLSCSARGEARRRTACARVRACPQ